MTTFELARKLLDAPNLPLVVYDTQTQVWREVRAVEDYMTHVYRDTHDNETGPTQFVPLSMLPTADTKAEQVNERLLKAVQNFDCSVAKAQQIYDELHPTHKPTVAKLQRKRKPKQ